MGHKEATSLIRGGFWGAGQHPKKRMKKGMAGGGHGEVKAPRCLGGTWAHLLGQAEEGPQESGLDWWGGADQVGLTLPP